MNTNNIYEIASLHSDIWWNHDFKEYNLLENSAENMFQKLGIEKTKSIKLSYLVRDVYYYYDQAVDSAKKTKHEQEHFFSLMNESNIKIMNILGFAGAIGDIYSTWIIFFHKKNIFLTAYYLFLYHLHTFSSYRKIFAPISVFLILISGYVGHNSKNKKLTIKLLSLYWRMIKLIKQKNFILY